MHTYATVLLISVAHFAIVKTAKCYHSYFKSSL